MTTSFSPTSLRLLRAMSRIVVSSPASGPTGTNALGNVSVYGRSLRPAPAASTMPIMLYSSRLRSTGFLLLLEVDHHTSAAPGLGPGADALHAEQHAEVSREHGVNRRQDP